MSLASLMLETLFTRIFSVTLWSHFAFMGVSVALLGLTTGGLAVYLWPWLGKKGSIETRLTQTALLFAGVIPISILALVWIPVKETEGTMAGIALVFQFLVLTLPFFFTGINVTLVLTRYGGQFRKLYAADLAGAALGCILFIGAVQILNPVQALFGVICLGFLSATAYAAPSRRLLSQSLPGLIFSVLLFLSDLAFKWIRPERFFNSTDLTEIAPISLTQTHDPSYRIVDLLMVFTLGITFLFIVVPYLLPKRKANRQDFGFIGYFILVGMGFMLIEIAQLQMLTDFLGDPNFGVSVVLCTLLLATGVGSYLTRTINRNNGFLRLGVLMVILAITEVASTLIIPELVDSSFSLKLIVSVLLLVPMGISMGMVIPVGMHFAKEIRPDMTPWYWSLNGSASVFASVLAVFLFLYFGVEIPFWIGVLCYGLAFGSFAIISKTLKTK